MNIAYLLLVELIIHFFFIWLNASGGKIVVFDKRSMFLLYVLVLALSVAAMHAELKDKAKEIKRLNNLLEDRSTEKEE